MFSVSLSLIAGQSNTPSVQRYAEFIWVNRCMIISRTRLELCYNMNLLATVLYQAVSREPTSAIYTDCYKSRKTNALCR